jgi:RNA polymerase sigma-70 factor (ECF subfamily)
MLGSVSEADDAIQETWLRLSRSQAGAIENLGGWLTTVIAHVCLDMLRSRKSRHEDVLDEQPEPVARRQRGADPEREAVLADSVGVALLVVLDRLEPAERLAFVLHDVFGMSFDEIAPIVDRSSAAARQLASRARRRVQGTAIPSHALRQQQRDVAYKFLAAARAGDLAGLLSVLVPDLVVHADEFAGRPGAPREIHGAETWARSALIFAKTVQFGTQPALVDGDVGMIWAPGGQLRRALRLTFADARIKQIEIIGDPARLAELEIAVLDNVCAA